MMLQSVQYFQDTLYHIIGDVIVVTNQYAVSFIEYVILLLYIYIIIIIFILNNIFLCIKAVEHGNWGGSGSCAQRLCECDRSFAECLKRYPCPTTKAVCTSSPWRLVQNLFMIM